jgi:hypothetical protein
VERPEGAVIWDVTTNNQILLAVGWDAIRKRNFIDRQGIFINTQGFCKVGKRVEKGRQPD